MGEARRRGSFEQRQAEAIRQSVIDKEEVIRQRILYQRDQLDSIKTRRPSKHLLPLVAILGSIGSIG